MSEAQTPDYMKRNVLVSICADGEFSYRYRYEGRHRSALPVMSVDTKYLAERLKILTCKYDSENNRYVLAIPEWEYNNVECLPEVGEALEKIYQKMPWLSPQDYRDAIHSQSAVNIPGLVYSFARVMPRIVHDVSLDGGGTDAWNRHPICRLYAEQMMHLTRGTSYLEAYSACQKGASLDEESDHGTV